MKQNQGVCRILYRIEDDTRYEWRATTELLASQLARDTALQIKRNGIQILVCPEEEFNEKGLPQTYEAEEYFTEGAWPLAQDEVLGEPSTELKLITEEGAPSRRPAAGTADTPPRKRR